MVWKPKEKELTLEETITLAKQELSPYWFGHSPMIAGTNNGGVYSIFQLDKEFSEHTWIVFVVDITSFESSESLKFSRLLLTRYGRFGVKCLFIVNPTYDFLTDPHSVRLFYEAKDVDFPVVVDHQKFLAHALNVKTPPGVSVFKKGRLTHQYFGDWTKKIEQTIHDTLRAGDPGLALLPIHVPNEKPLMDKHRMELGKGLGFKPISIHGKWQQDAQSIVSRDPDASIQFKINGRGLGLVARSVANSGLYGKVMIELNEEIPPDQLGGEDLVHDEAGIPCLKVREGRLYHALSQMDPGDSLIRLSFPEAKTTPIALYGIRVH